MARAEGHHRVDHRLQGLGHESLQDMAFDRQAHPRHRGKPRGMARPRQRDFARTDESLGGFHTSHHAFVDPQARDLAMLDDVDPAPVSGAGIAPCHRIMAHRAAALLQQAAFDRKTGIIKIEERHKGPHLIGIEQFGIHSIETQGIAAPHIGIALGVGVAQVQHAALRHHRVEIDVLLQPFPQLERQFIKGGIAGQQIVGTDDGGVAPDIARADIAFLDHGNAADIVVLGEIMGSGQTMTTAADNHHIIMTRRLGAAPGRRPAALAGHGIEQKTGK